MLKDVRHINMEDIVLLRRVARVNPGATALMSAAADLMFQGELSPSARDKMRAMLPESLRARLPPVRDLAPGAADIDEGM